MSVPMRKDEFVEKDEIVEENLTTADLAQGKRPVPVDDRHLGDRSGLLDDRPKDDWREDDRAKDDRVKDEQASDRPRPVLAERSVSEVGPTVGSDIRAADDRGVDTRSGSNVNRTAADTPLFPNDELEELRNRWSTVQTAFVDEPRRAVEQADGLVASAMKRLAEVFAEERSNLEHQWDRGDNVSTEDLRIALQRYRSFFQRLLSI